jgi:preprotein translocase subunit SecY
MKRFITTLKNIWSITELRNRILTTLIVLVVYRFGSYIVLPGVIPAALDAQNAAGEKTNDLIGLINGWSF